MPDEHSSNEIVSLFQIEKLMIFIDYERRAQINTATDVILQHKWV